uniref:Uncharacterized protein n=1 Tax=Caenorhabditis tropicalis TaxID=1561998 RepID=A0A1I7UG85_9PELO
MNRTESDEKDLNQNQKGTETKKEEEDEKKENSVGRSARFQSKNQKEKKKKKPMDSDSAVYEIDELNSTIAPSSSRQCIIWNSGTTSQKTKKKEIQRTEFHPRPPFSCVPIYTAILLGLLIVLIVGAVTTIVDMRPAFIYGQAENSTVLGLNKTLTAIVEPPRLFHFQL